MMYSCTDSTLNEDTEILDSELSLRMNSECPGTFARVRAIGDCIDACGEAQGTLIEVSVDVANGTEVHITVASPECRDRVIGNAPGPFTICAPDETPFVHIAIPGDCAILNW